MCEETKYASWVNNHPEFMSVAFHLDRLWTREQRDGLAFGALVTQTFWGRTER